MEQRTLAIVKPDGVERGHIGEVVRRIERSGLTIEAMKMVRMDRAEAAGFYDVHQGKPFFDDLTAYMSSGPVVLMVLRGDGAIRRWREMMGATNPAKAAPGTIRHDLGIELSRNTVHGSDAPETAAYETSYFFNAFERCPRD